MTGIKMSTVQPSGGIGTRTQDLPYGVNSIPTQMNSCSCCPGEPLSRGIYWRVPSTCQRCQSPCGIRHAGCCCSGFGYRTPPHPPSQTHADSLTCICCICRGWHPMSPSLWMCLHPHMCVYVCVWVWVWVWCVQVWGVGLEGADTCV